MARTYKRDSRGRFAGGGGSSRPKVTGGTLKARTSARRSKAKLAAKDPADQSMKGTLSRRSQKGAVTKASKALQAAQQSGRVRLSGRGGVIRPGGKKRNASRKKASAPISAATTTKGLKSVNQALRLLDNSHQDNALTRSIGRLPFRQQRAKMDRIDARASSRRRELWSRLRR